MKTDGDLQRLAEKVEILDGSRARGNRDQAAVRIADLKGLMTLKTRLKSAKAAGATPTKAEFDALVDDVVELHLRMKAIVEALQARIIL